MLKVVVIDDDPIALDAARAALEGMGNEVVTRSSAMGARAAVMKEAPDIVLVDIQMPALPGDEWLELVSTDVASQMTTGPCYVIYSGAEEAQLAAIVKETCAVGYICKSAGVEHFEREIRRITRSLV